MLWWYFDTAVERCCARKLTTVLSHYAMTLFEYMTPQHGCMGALNDGVTERCGRVRGVIHEMWIVDKSEHPGIKDLTVVGGEGLQVWVLIIGQMFHLFQVEIYGYHRAPMGQVVET